MKKFVRAILPAVTVAALLLSFPATSPAQNQPSTTNVQKENPYTAFEKYDFKATITVAGTVTRVNWANPLVHIYVDAKDAAGKLTTWDVEGHSPNKLTRSGFSRDAIKNGDMISISAYRAKNGSNTASGYEITLADGSKKTMGPSDGEQSSFSAPRIGVTNVQKENPYTAFEKYDFKAPVTVAGTVARVDWANPLVHIYVDAKDASGKLTTWDVEGHSPNKLTRSGFSRDAIKNGDMISISAYRAKDGSNTASGYEITLADGSKKTMGPSDGEPTGFSGGPRIGK